MTLTSDAAQVDRAGRRARGGPEANARLTATTGVLLVLLLAVQGWTILSITRRVEIHVFVGLLLTAPVCLKLASAAYRFVRYYTGAPAYRRQGPPPLARRLLGPLLIAATLAVFATGLTLGLTGGNTGSVPVLLLHKLAFVGWISLTSLHVLLNLPQLARLLNRPVPRAARRWALIALALAVGTALGLAGEHLANAWRS
ncbi:hypothetical protein [Kitasatospora viridis]|uniref:Uncharacterized protein n=1 Tax=Kitasatospora viridis TaxID=281105 RepID=A0A561S978_9ACTN|nr:hypothetical protein [Kitasatospora viridis]TWF71422.1 hypothetical protein FHX73_1952 [Kitasatospora viridis]